MRNVNLYFWGTYLFKQLACECVVNMKPPKAKFCFNILDISTYAHQFLLNVFLTYTYIFSRFNIPEKVTYFKYKTQKWSIQCL